MIWSCASWSIRPRTRSPVPSGEASSITSTSAWGADSWPRSTRRRMLLASSWVGIQMSWPATRRTIPVVSEPTLRIAHLYADEMNIYGDRGNILTLTKRAQWRGIAVDVEAIGRGPAPDLSGIDLIFWGGGQDRDQELVFRDAARHKVTAIRSAIDGGAVVLAGCGGGQILREYFVTAGGRKVAGLGLVEPPTDA